MATVGRRVRLHAMALGRYMPWRWAATCHGATSCFGCKPTGYCNLMALSLLEMQLRCDESESGLGQRKADAAERTSNVRFLFQLNSAVERSAAERKT